MTKYPLFGQDSVPQYTSKVLGLIGTGIFWLIFLLLMIFVKPIDRKPKYKEVQIVLSSTPAKASQPEPAAAAEPAPSAMQNTAPAEAVLETPAAEIVPEVPVPEPVVETPKAPEPAAPKPEPVVETPKPAPAPKKVNKTEPKPVQETPKTVSKKVETVKQPEPTFTGEYVDPMEAFEAQTKKSPKKDFNWDDFDDTTVSETAATERTAVKPKPVDSSFSGSAGETVKQNVTSAKSSSAAVNNNKLGTSKGTNTALDAIENTQGSVPSSTQGTVKESSSSSATDSNSSLKWANGAARKMLMPKTPKLVISPENQSKVTATEVNVTFTVNKDGYVVRSSVTTNPPIAQSVLDEIQDQIAEWWFDSGSDNATATLVWKIQRN